MCSRVIFNSATNSYQWMCHRPKIVWKIKPFLCTSRCTLSKLGQYNACWCLGYLWYQVTDRYEKNQVCQHFHVSLYSLAPGRPRCHFKTAIFNLVLLIGIFTSSKDNALRWMPRDLTDDKSTLVQVMAWCHQATSHYLSQCWPRSLLPYDVTRPQNPSGHALALTLARYAPWDRAPPEMHPLKMFEILGHPHFKQLHIHKIFMKAKN